MKNIFLLVLCFLVLASCNQEVTVQDDDTILTVEDTVIDSTEDIVIEDDIELETNLEPEVDSETLDFSTISFMGNGTEPFWGFNASGSTFVLREPSDTGPMDTTTFTGVVMTDLGTSVNMTSAGMNLDLVLGTCSDGMSDLTYIYFSIFTAGSTSYTGCANID